MALIAALAALRELPRCTRTGLPIPFVVPRRRGVGSFRRLIPKRIMRCCSEQRCQVCGDRFEREESRIFIAEGDRQLQPPMHEPCARLALARCPHLQTSTERVSLIFAAGADVVAFDDTPMLIAPTDVRRVEVIRGAAV